MISADGKNAKAAEKVEIAYTVAIVEILALSLLEPDVVPDRFENPDELLI